MIKERLKQKKGITLISLIVTVIILMILLGLITAVISDDIFVKADKTELHTENLVVNAQDKIDDIKDSVPDIEDAGAILTFNVEVSNITTTSATITAILEDGDDAEYTIVLANTEGTVVYQSGPAKKNVWNITGLSAHQTYIYEVSAQNDIDTFSTTGSFKTLNTKPTVEVETNVTPTTATITATGNDADGDILLYKTIVKNASGTTIYESDFTTTSSWPLTSLSEKTAYTYEVKVTDGYDTTSKTGSFTTTKSNTAPVITSNVDYKSGKTTTKFTIEMAATDADGDNLTYTLYASTAQNGTYYQVGTATGTSGGSKTIPVTAINGTALTQYTQYWWKIQVTDSKDTVTSEVQSLRTYCPGTGSTCRSTTLCNNISYTCPSCNGVGTQYENCTSKRYEVDYSDWSGTQFEHYTPEEGNYCMEYIRLYNAYCTTCGGWNATLCVCSVCGYTEPIVLDQHNMPCSTCNGDGKVDDGVYTYCSTHNSSVKHNYCNTHSYVGSSSTHTYCSHGQTTQHDS